MERWYVTWRHINQNSRSAMTHYAESREEALEIQKNLLEQHESHVCAKCMGIEKIPLGYLANGNNASIVTKVRTEKEIRDFLAKPQQAEERFCYHPVTYCTHPSHNKD